MAGGSNGTLLRAPPPYTVCGLGSKFKSSATDLVCRCFLPCSEGFSLGSPVFVPPQKQTSPDSNRARIEGPT